MLRLKVTGLLRRRCVHTAARQSDVVVIGAGVVGMAMLAGLVSSQRMAPMHVTMIDANQVHGYGGWMDRMRERTRAATDRHDGIPWENRVISMTAENLGWLRTIGAEAYLDASRMRAVDRIRVWDGLTDAAAEFSNETTLSTMVELSNLQQALYRYVQDRLPRSRLRLTIQDAARVARIEADTPDDWPRITFQDEAGEHVVRTRLLVGADGARSPVRTFAGIESYGWSYGCKGLVATLRTGLHTRSAEPVVDTMAWQRFMPTGTLACLPLSPTAGTIVWALPPELCDPIVAMHRAARVHCDGTSSVLATLISAAFRLPWALLEPILYGVSTTAPEALERRVLDVMASYEQSGAAPSAFTGAVPPWGDAVDARGVASFPLQLKHAGCYIGSRLQHPGPLSTALTAALTALSLTPGGAARGGGQGRTVLVGDAAHSTHPLAGQGLNMGLQDVRALCEALQDASLHGMDIGTHQALQPYERARYLPNQIMLSVTDHLHWLFATRPASPYTHPMHPLQRSLREQALRALVWARSTGLDVVNELGPLKRLLTAGAGSARS
ncbi:ubiquinone biosynthesis monooxygenase Coq6 [Malassezia restricta]|uniref:ubiquinone biosynthesis monooxygenase Coq6 n=1 Tax=Malassezia restricta TaxID=76775 RepID=UPI000DD1536A|nr:ubiquinone biosynthesis monooxygenase Coq6 [Malassezia restricta]AXA51716.1 ubiquinone biosynthesis monooxygenase Coq6 [Malassezia restricta]